MAPFFDRAHVLAMPTRSEAFGVVFVEAVSAGLPVLGSDVGNVPWIVGAAGICPPVGDVDTLASALLEMLQSYPQFAELSARRGKEFRASCSWEAIAADFLNVLEIPVRGRSADPSRGQSVIDPIVVAVLVTYNRFDALTESLASVLAQSRPPDAVIVVDNNSADGTADRLAAAEPGVDIICMPENLGPGAAIATGMRQAFSHGAEIVWLVEDDTLYGADYLRDGVQCLVEQPTIAMLGSHGWDFDGFLWHGHASASNEIAHGVLPALDGALVRRNDALSVGFPAENYFLMMDDVEYPLRMYEHKRVVAVWSQLQSRPLRLGASSEPGGPPFRSYYQTRNHLRMVLDRRSGAMTWGFLRRTAALVVTDVRKPRCWQRWAMRAVGMLDATRGRMGRTVEPGQPWPVRR